jgi:signal transduction histidine kinase
LVAFDVLSPEQQVPQREAVKDRAAGVTGARRRGLRLGIAGKVALLKISFGLVTAGVISVFLYHAMQNFVVERQREGQVADIAVANGRLSLQFESAQRDVILALNAPAFESQVRALTNGGTDDSSLTLARTRTGELFRALLTARPNYLAIKFIDRDGYETILAVRNPDGSAAIVPPSNLQTVKQHPYFAEAAKLPRGKIYVADIELLQEQGRVVEPHVPIARVSAPAYGADGRLAGVVTINVDARKMFKVASDVLPAGARLYIADGSGSYLLNPAPGAAFGPARIQNDFPALGSLVDGARASYSAATPDGGEATLLSASALAFDPGNLARHLVIASRQVVSVSFSQLGSGGEMIATVFALVILMGGLTALVLLRILVVPLRRIRATAVSLAAGNRMVDMGRLGQRHDEIGDLAVSIDAMARAIREREDRLTAQAAELSRSNQDLAQFAYVASHDLQEPLRMVGSYLELLSRRYKGKLDQEADEFIGFAVDGATRMKRLINDLLGYSRTGSTPLKREAIDVGEVLKNVIASLAVRLEETGGKVEIGPMPTIIADGAQIERVFLNLIDNALKYHSAAPPHIHVTAVSTEAGWSFTVADNGIGIDPRFSQQIFEIFKRLHGRDQYSGTGIGLAVTKLAVERHGGNIHVRPADGGGSAFEFEIPQARMDA